MQITKGEEVEKRENWGHFHCTWGEKYNYFKKEVGQKYPILGKYIPLDNVHRFIAVR